MLEYYSRKTEKRLIVDFIAPGVDPNEDAKVTVFDDSENGRKVEAKVEVKKSVAENRNSGFYKVYDGKHSNTYDIEDSLFDLSKAEVSFYHGVIRVSIPKHEWALGTVIHPSEEE